MSNDEVDDRYIRRRLRKEKVYNLGVKLRSCHLTGADAGLARQRCRMAACPMLGSISSHLLLTFLLLYTYGCVYIFFGLPVCPSFSYTYYTVMRGNESRSELHHPALLVANLWMSNPFQNGFQHPTSKQCACIAKNQQRLANMS